MIGLPIWLLTDRVSVISSVPALGMDGWGRVDGWGKDGKDGWMGEGWMDREGWEG